MVSMVERPQVVVQEGEKRKAAGSLCAEEGATLTSTYPAAHQVKGELALA